MLFALKKFISYWLTPMSLCVVMMITGLFLLRKPQRARLGRALIVAGLFSLLLLSNKFVSWSLVRPLENRYPAIPEFFSGTPVPADLAACRFVVVLGGGNGYTPGVSANNLLAGSSVGRITEAVRILRVLPDARLIVTGPGPANLDSHAVVLARTAQALGIAADRILYIDQARDTEEEAAAVYRLAHGSPVALVTSAIHLPRSVALFRAAGLVTLPCPADFRTHDGDEFTFSDLLWNPGYLDRSSFALRERLGSLWIWLRGKS